MIEEILNKFERAKPTVDTLKRVLCGEREIRVSGLSGSLKSFLIGFLSLKLHDRWIFVILKNEEECEKLKEDLETISCLMPAGTGISGEEIFFFPKKGVERGRTPPLDISGERICALCGVSSRKFGILIGTKESILEGTISKERLEKQRIVFKKNESYEFEGLIEKIMDLGYERRSTLTDIGEVSVRGGIVDIFSYGMENPVRIEFEGDIVSSLREFEPISQRSIKDIEYAEILPRWETCEETSLHSYVERDKKLWVVDGFLMDSQLNISGMTGNEKMNGAESVFEGQKILLMDFSLGKGEVAFGGRLTGRWEGVMETFRMEMWSFLRDGFSCYIFCDNEGQRERMREIILEEKFGGIPVVGSIHNGFVFPGGRFVILTDHEIYSRYRFRRRYRKFARGAPIRDYLSLSSGDFVVHLNFGIGRYQGLERLEIDGQMRDCMSLVYKDGDKVYVPLEEMKQVEKYIGKEGILPALSKLGSGTWEQVKSRARRAVSILARDLLRLYAIRKTERGFKFSPDTPWQGELESSFPYEETEDQLRAASEIKSDMESEKPMDRLLCGDVGYGKTEVALRACFKAVMDGKQACVLVPTTILAEQHLRVFRERLANFPVRIEMLSRFLDKKCQKEIVKDTKDGKVDILIGTHRLIQRDVDFKEIGLLVIDEEHRFGVRHKEKLKGFRESTSLKIDEREIRTSFKPVDVLTMTATPIPRTLYFSLSGVRDISCISEAPKGRLSVVTRICEFDDEVICEAVEREIGRGGQVFFVHNRVETIEGMASYLRKILPGVKICVAHGKQEEKVLERVMLDFMDGKYEMLLSTTIIESGLDIPNANTMLVNQAHKFGLAQLYQLRGRVGRSDRRAYCYFLIPKEGRLSPEAKKRLSIIEEFAELGSGFRLAMRDLEIRGAGNLLGHEQHGHMMAVGFNLYCKLLEDAVKESKGEKIEEEIEPRIQVDIEAYIPDSYISDGEEKIAIYRRLAGIEKIKELEQIKEELKDRFGQFSESVRNLLWIVEIKLLAKHAKVEKLILKGNSLRLEFGNNKELKDFSVIIKKLKGAEFSEGKKEKLNLSVYVEGNREEFVKNLLLRL